MPILCKANCGNKALLKVRNRTIEIHEIHLNNIF